MWHCCLNACNLTLKTSTLCLKFFSLWFAFQPAFSGLGTRTEGTRKNSTLICVPIVSESIDKMIVDVKKAGENGADIVEIRLDALKIFNPHEDLKLLIKESPLPTLFTYRYLAGIFPP